jgi:hypothetical protein
MNSLLAHLILIGVRAGSYSCHVVCMEISDNSKVMVGGVDVFARTASKSLVVATTGAASRQEVAVEKCKAWRMKWNLK